MTTSEIPQPSLSPDAEKTNLGALSRQTRTNLFSHPLEIVILGDARTYKDDHLWNWRDADSSCTSVTVSHSKISDNIRALFHNAAYETFEDGMDSDFNSNLTRIIQDHGSVAVEALEKLIHANVANIEVVSEALICLGRVKDNDTHRVRLKVLENALDSDNVCIRDAASIAIESMDDPLAIDSIKNAMAKETCAPLRQNLKDVLMQLQDAT